ncbi:MULTISPECIES: ABC transporter substrate-binding protein [unclassified Leptolyngbya]|uniref:ABC transporter substrate-binding protein n=1 Tax=unclassified Leptolyngbya TaxID=2650499 RepID=UPI00168330CA|nr:MULTISPECIES: ABC transporter substrate-binding protein [unclassified Leptolyngbya]MBD1913795.1 ABC transporter substrate-binding protein [Leptolyngbya sp. FACHB-8]MBD2153611.1 ABC transporter substrate-binding protein [Leptolyngbya sp. FACHB-16]
MTLYLPRRRFLTLSAGACLATLVTNCASNGSSQSQESAFDPKTATWDEIVAAARGTTVNWAMWGGSDNINKFADDWVGSKLQSEYSVTLNRVPLNDTVEAVNKVVSEVQAGLKSGGSIDLIWINGENFRTMKQGNLLYGPFTDKLPAMQHYDLSNPAVLSDFGLPIDGYEAPYTGSYYVMAVNGDRVPQPPQNFQELLAWAQANPGRFAYVAPPAFDGSRFLLTALYGTTGGYDQYAGAEFQETLWNEKSPQLVEYLKQLEPHLWRKGETYPPTANRLTELFANGEIWMMPIFVSSVAEGLATGQLPPSTRAFTMPGISLNDPSFTAIPVNANNPAGAMILANILASPEGQLQKFKPDVWGDPPLLDVSKISPELQKQFTATETSYGMPLKTLTQDTVPVVNAEYTTRLEQIWEQEIA